MTDLPVLIIGAGCTGLSLASGLAKSHIPYLVFEKHTQLHPPHHHDWNMGMHWGLPFLTSVLPPTLSTRLVTATIDPSIPPGPDCHLQSVNGLTGAVLADFPVGTWYRLKRRDLRALLASGLDPNAIKYGHKLSSYTVETADDGSPTVLARFANGEEVRGRLLVGADGASSVVRTLLLGEARAKIVPMPFSALFVQSRYDAATAAYLRENGGLYLNAIHPAGMVGWWGVHDVRDPDDPASWTLYFNISFRTDGAGDGAGDGDGAGADGGSNGETVLLMQEQSEKAEVPTNEKAAAMREKLAKLKEIGSTFCEPWKTASAALEPDTQCWQMKFGTWDPGEEGHRWDGKGVVTLAGDAAHAMTYQRGQGLNHALADAANLIKAIVSFAANIWESDGAARPTQLAAINAYETEMIARGGEEARLSWQNTTLLHNWEKALESPLFKTGMKIKN